MKMFSKQKLTPVGLNLTFPDTAWILQYTCGIVVYFHGFNGCNASLFASFLLWFLSLH